LYTLTTRHKDTYFFRHAISLTHRKQAYNYYYRPSYQTDLLAPEQKLEEGENKTEK
ncbi:unnamed protein product, partial [Amoebophrya sp. A25]